MKRIFVLAASLGLALASCARSLHPQSGDDAPEAFVGAARLHETFRAEDGWLVSPILEAPALATRVAVWLSTDAPRAPLLLEARATREDGSVGAWRAVEWRWTEDVQHVGRVDLGAFVAAEVRVPASEADALSGLVYSAVVADEHVVEGVRAPSTTTQAISLPGIEPRSAWNARANSGCSANETKTRISVHHSVSALQANGSRADHAAAVRGIQAYHMDGRGYCDIGYHWAVTADGTVWEAREARFLGAHAANQNTNNAGIVFVGCFHPVADCNGLGGTTPPANMVQAGGTAIGTIAAHYGISVGNTTVIGHRDNPGQSTSCPGDNLHSLLPQLRDIASGGGQPVTTTGKVQGVVWDLSITTDASQSDDLNARIEGATISVSGGPTTTSRAGDAYWSFDLEPGTYTVTASVNGYAPASRDVQITSGANLWASIGVAPQAQSVSLEVLVFDAATELTLLNASVQVTGADPAQTDEAGIAQFSVAAGEVTITASAEGYEPKTVTRTYAGGSVLEEIGLNAIVLPGEGEGEEEPKPPEPDEVDPQGEVSRVTILPAPKTSGGCTCAGNDEDPGPVVVLLLSAGMLFISARAFRRRRA